MNAAISMSTATIKVRGDRIAKDVTKLMFVLTSATGDAMADDWTQRDDGKAPARMDFVMRSVELDETTGAFAFEMLPDPRRHDEIKIKGKPHYLDKFLKHAVSKEMMQTAMVEQAKGLPMFVSPSAIGSSQEYADARRLALSRERQSGAYEAPPGVSKQQEQLVTNRRRALSFLSVDICGSTALRASNREGFDRAYELFVRELGTVIGQFHGDVLKTTGDGLLAYLDYPGFTLQCDNTLDLGLTLIRVLREAVNPTLTEEGIPELRVRVGADIGSSSVKEFAVPSTGYREVDVVSDALSRSVKIEQSAADNELRIGRDLYELLHVQWLQRCAPVEFDGTTLGRPGYEVYRVT